MTSPHFPSVSLNPAQQAVVDRGLLTSGFSCVLQMPTGSGKTWLAEQAIHATLEGGARAIYLTPLRALANELVTRWSKLFEGFEVGVFTGEYGQRQAYPVPFERAQLLIMTPERLDACTRHWRSHWGWIPEVSLLVVDEMHLLGEPGRGPRLEGALMRIRRLNPFLQVIGLSATLGNRTELADWLTGIHFGSDWRALPVEWRYARYQRAADKPRILKEEVTRCIDEGGQSLVFVQSRRRAEALSNELRETGISAGHHHAGLDSKDRCQLEEQFRSGNLRALVSTGTLEMGLNLPARQVVLYDLQKFDGTDFVPLSVNTVWQRAGRAGRHGLDTRGEVVLIAPTWDRNAGRYIDGRFERILSNLSDRRSLAEQVLAEVSSGLARTRAQLDRNLQDSLASHQRKLPPVDRVVREMIDSGMLIEVTDGQERAIGLKATRLGRIAVRQMLEPATVVLLMQGLQGSNAETLKFFDILLLCVQTNDCEPRIPVDFEELENLGAQLSEEGSVLLTGTHAEIIERFGMSGRKLLAIIKTALIARAWTHLGCTETVADNFGCYAFEVRRLSESLQRILAAAVAVVTPTKKEGEDETKATGDLDDTPNLRERLQALAAMIGHGVDEQTVTLTSVPGIGGTLARRLRDADITDIEDLALAEPDDLAKVRGVSRFRASRWIEQATELIRTRSAFFLRETAATTCTHATWASDIEPYRLRRAMDLLVRKKGESFAVSGGLEPHRVRFAGKQWACDCADFGKGNICKHVLAIRLHRKDPHLIPLVQQLSSDQDVSALDLFQLWFERGNQ